MQYSHFHEIVIVTLEADPYLLLGPESVLETWRIVLPAGGANRRKAEHSLGANNPIRESGMLEVAMPDLKMPRASAR